MTAYLFWTAVRCPARGIVMQSAPRVHSAPMAFSSSTIESEYLLSAAPSDVLRYLDKCAPNVPHWARRSITEWDLPEATISGLFQRNERAIDIGLARICEPKLGSTLLTRHTDASGMPDAVLLEALCSNLRAGEAGLSEVAPWLQDHLPYIAKSSPPNVLRALFGNPSLSHKVLNAALRATEAFAGLTRQRRGQIVAGALKCPVLLNVEKIEREIRDYDSAGHESLGYVSTLLLTEEPSPEMGKVLRWGFEDLSTLEVPYHKRLEPILGLPENSLTFETATLAFLRRAFERWKDTEAQSYGPLREVVAAKVYAHRDDVKQFLSTNPDRYVRRGYYRQIYMNDVRQLQACFNRDGRDFLEGGVKNELLFSPHLPKLAKAFFDLVQSAPPSKEDNEFDNLRRRYYWTFDRLRKQSPLKYPREPSDYEKWSIPEFEDPADSETLSEVDRFASVRKRLDELAAQLTKRARQFPAWASWLTFWCLVYLVARTV
jgi:hypothetical protein